MPLLESDCCLGVVVNWLVWLRTIRRILLGSQPPDVVAVAWLPDPIAGSTRRRSAGRDMAPGGAWFLPVAPDAINGKAGGRLAGATRCPATRDAHLKLVFRKAKASVIDDMDKGIREPIGQQHCHAAMRARTCSHECPRAKRKSEDWGVSMTLRCASWPFVRFLDHSPMNLPFFSRLTTVLLALIASLHATETYNFNPDWRFLKADPAGAEAPGVDDSSWQMVSAPHTYTDTFDDWSPLGHVGEINPWAGRTRFRKSFTPPVEWAGKSVMLEFEATRDLTVYIMHDQRLAGERMDWLKHDFTDSGLIIRGGKNRTWSLYQRKIGKGETVLLGSNCECNGDQRWMMVVFCMPR